MTYLFDLPPGEAMRRLEPNPCRILFGPGPDGKFCETCAHLTFWNFNPRYRKCGQCSLMQSAAYDHQPSWRACARYLEERRP